MDSEDLFDRCLIYLDSQTKVQPGPVPFHNPVRMAVSISRQAGSGAVRIAQRLAEYLQARAAPDERPWTVFDQNLITKVLEDHHLPARLAKFLPEDRVSAISDTVDEILGLHPPSWVIVRQSVETMLRLAELGNVVLVGRGANAITSRLPNVFRVRLVGSLEQRIARVQEMEHLSRPAARGCVRRHDRGRAAYVRKYFHQDITNVLLHDVIINTDRLSEDEVVRLIGEPVLRRIQSASAQLQQAA